MSLSADRDTKQRFEAQLLSLPVKTDTLIYAGALVAMGTDGYAVPASADPTLIVIGRAESRFDNSAGASGAISASIRRGVFRFDNSSSGDAITEAAIGEDCYAVSDSQVALTSGPGTRPRAGSIFDVDDKGVWVDTGEVHPARKVYVTVHAIDLVAADAQEYSFLAPVAGRITKITSVLDQHAIAAADATITGKIGGTAITTGVITHPSAGSAVGEKKSAVPTAANAVAVGDRVSFLVGGGNTNAAAQASLLVEITL